MKKNREELLHQLTLIVPGLSKKERIQSSSVSFIKGHLTAYNDKCIVMVPCEMDFEGAIHAEELISVLQKLKAAEVDIFVDKGQVIIKAGRAKSGIKYEPDVFCPITEFDLFDDALKREVPEGFFTALKRAAFCAATDMGRGILTGVYVKDGVVYACNNYKAMRVQLQDAADLPEFCVPANAVDIPLKYEFTHIGITKTWMFLSGKDGILFALRLLDLSEEYPDMSKIFDLGGKDGVKITLPENLVDVIDKTSIFTKSIPTGDSKFVTITLRSGRVILKGEGPFGWYEEQIPAKDYEGDKISFAVQPDFLTEILPHLQQATYVYPCLMFEGDGFKYVFAIMRQNDGDGEGE